MTSNRPHTGFRYLDDAPYPGGVLAIAHRGGALHPDNAGLENTLKAFRHALDLGYRYLETDVHATRDGVLLAFHDPVLERVTGIAGRIERMQYDEVADALVGGREPIPRLTDLLEALPEARLNIDIKAPGAIGPLVEAISRHQAHDRVCVGSFSERSIRTFRALIGPGVATVVGPAAAAATRYSPVPRLTEVLLRDRGAVFQVPHRFRGTATIATPEFVRRVHDAGKHVHVWTVDDAAEMHELLDRGVDGLITDRTDTLREVLLERGAWPGEETR